MIYPESLIKTIQLHCDNHESDTSLIGSISEAVGIYNDLNRTNVIGVWAVFQPTYSKN